MEQSLHQDQILPERLQRALRQRTLGQPEAVFQKKNLSFGALIGSLIVSGFVLFLVYGITASLGSPTTVDAFGDAHTQMSWWPPNVVADGFLVLWIVLGLLLFLYLWRTYRVSEDALCVYPQGLAPVQFRAIRDWTRHYAWDQIETVWRGSSSQSEGEAPHVFLDTIKLQLSSKEKFNFDRSWDKDNTELRRGLCDRIEAELVRRHLPALLAHYDQGHLLDLGALRISRTSLSNGEEVLSWSEVEAFEVGEDLIRIRKVGKLLDWYSCLTPAFPNACLLRALTAQRLKS